MDTVYVVTIYGMRVTDYPAKPYGFETKTDAISFIESQYNQYREGRYGGFADCDFDNLTFGYSENEYEVSDSVTHLGLAEIRRRFTDWVEFRMYKVKINGNNGDN